MSEKNIVIVGASYAGINTAHYILKYTIPRLPTTSTYNVILLNPSPDFYHRHASPRSLVSEKAYPDEKIFINIASAFSQYSTTHNFRFIQGIAVGVDPLQRLLFYTSSPATSANERSSLPYTSLIIASGCRSTSPYFSDQGKDGSEVRHALTQMRKDLSTATTVVVGGGGPSGVETAGEIGEALNGPPPGLFQSIFGPKKERKVKITLITAGGRLVPILKESLGKEAEKKLNAVGVDVVYRTRIVAANQDENSGKWKFELAGGVEMGADVFVDAKGTFPSVSYLPAEWIDDKNKVKVMQKTLRVDDQVNGQRVYCVGDVGSHTPGGVMDLLATVPVLAYNLMRDLMEEAGQPLAGNDGIHTPAKGETQLVVIGPSGGVGAFGGTQMPSFVIKLIKGKDYFYDRVAAQINGNHWKKEVKV